MDSLQDVLTNLLRNLASRREIDQYLREFTNVDSTKFAVIKVGGGILRDQRQELASALAFLHRVGLFPIVVHGAGPQINEALEDAAIPTRTVEGMRYTSPEVLAVVRRVLHQENLALVETLEQCNTRARPVTSGVFQARPLEPDRFGHVGEIESVNLHPIEAAIRSGQLPIVACLGESAGGQILNVNGDVAARSLAVAVQPYKVIFLTPTGGLLDGHGRVIEAINLVEDFEDLIDSTWVNGGMALKLRQIKQLLDDLPDASSVSITCPDHLARELFTHRGSGTLVRRGDPIVTADAFDQVDTTRLRGLLENGFGRPLRDDYFATRQVRRIYLTGRYSAAAVTTEEGGVPYLDKFAVTVEAQAAGLGASLWSRLRRDTPRMFWRARPDNPVNPWYFRQAEGTHRTDDWVVFWYGLPSWDDIDACISRALAIPPSLATQPVKEHAHESPHLDSAGSVIAAGV